jgi:hypothetical protein
MPQTSDRAGRCCPSGYRYSPAVFSRPDEIEAETLYLVGGLYGNRFALDTVYEMAAAESGSPRMVFNGDFNWFNVHSDSFSAINDSVLRHTALRGNVETELASDDPTIIEHLADAYAKVGKPEGALARYKDALAKTKAEEQSKRIREKIQLLEALK